MSLPLASQVDLPSAILSTVALASIYYDLHVLNEANYRPATRGVRSGAVLFLWLRVPRIFLLMKKSGPMILMIFHMVDDVLHFLTLLGAVILPFAAAFLINFEPEATTADWPWTSNAFEEGNGTCEAQFTTILDTLLFLIEAAFSGNAFFSCSRNLAGSLEAMWAWTLTMLFFLLTTLLLLNMLIAMMTKSFENVADAQAINYRLLVAQTTFSIRDEGSITAPLNLLSIPYYACCAVGHVSKRVVRMLASPRVAAKQKSGRLMKTASTSSRGNRSRTTLLVDESVEKREPTHKLRAMQRKGENSARSMHVLHEVEKYLHEGLDSVFQEERWRTSLSKEVRKVRREVKRIAKNQTNMQMRNEMMAESKVMRQTLRPQHANADGKANPVAKGKARDTPAFSLPRVSSPTEDEVRAYDHD